MTRLLTHLFAVLVLVASLAVATPIQAIQVARGGDLLQTTATIHLNLPADFFGAGSAAFVGEVQATGVTLETVGPYEVGTTSLVLERRTAIPTSIAIAGSATVATQVLDLTLAGTQPISVSFGSTTQTWAVFAGLSESPGPYGAYTLTRTGATQGTFTANIPVPITLQFKNGSLSKRLDIGTANLTTSTGTWTTIATSPTAVLAVTGLPLGVALTGTLVSSSLDLVMSPAQGNLAQPGPAYVDTSAVIDPNVGSLGRGCSIGAGVSIAAGAVIGRNAVIADNVQVGPNVIVGEFSSIGVASVLNGGATLDSTVVLGAGCLLDANASVETGANLGSGCQLGANVRVGEHCVLRSNCVVGSGTRLEGRVHCGAGVSFSPNLEIADGATVQNGTSVTQSIAKCYLVNGTIDYRNLPVSSWPSLVAPPTAAIHQDSGAGGDGSNAQTSVSAPPADPNNPPPGSGQLPADVGSDIARPTCGGTGQEYTEGTYQCGWFAESLRHKLEDLGYSTSFTVVHKKNSKSRWYNKAPKWVDGHAYTDVHWANGTTTWIEAQFVGVDGVGAPKLDGNGDGKVTHYDHQNGDDTTDGDMRIQVYDNRSQAAAAGNNIVGS